MGSSNLLFSVIMPCYNSQEYVSDAVKSLLSQTYQNWELIAVNDGSTDNTLMILNEFANLDNRIKVYSKRQGGYASAVNFGLEKVSGNYFLMFGSDDRLSSCLFSEIINNIDNSLPDLITFRSVRYYENGETGVDFFTDFENKVFLKNSTIYDFYKQYPDHSTIMFYRDTSKCYKTKLRGNLKLFGKYGVDADSIFSTLFVNKCSSFLCLPIDGYFWTIRNDSISFKMNTQKNLDRISNWIKYINVIKKQKNMKFPDPEGWFLVTPFRIATELLKEKHKINLFNILKLHTSLRKSIRVSIKMGFYLSEHHELLNYKGVRRIIFFHLPILYLLRHGFVD